MASGRTRAPRSRTKTSTAVGGDLGVHVDPGGAGVLGRVGDRLAGGAHDRAQRLGRWRSRRRSTTSTEMPWASSTSAATPRSALATVRSSVDSPANSQRPQVALLRPGQAGDGGGVAGVLLDQGEGLQHGVVEVGGHVGALLGAHPLLALGGQVGGEPEDPRPDHDRRCRRCRAAAAISDVAGGLERAVAETDDEDRARRAARRRPRPGRRPPSRRRRETARTGSTRPVLSSQRSRCASSACRHSSAMPTTPITIGQSSAPWPKSASRRKITPSPSTPSVITGPTSVSRRIRPGRRPPRRALSRPGASPRTARRPAATSRARRTRRRRGRRARW